MARKKSRASEKTLDQINTWNQSDINRWQERNTRFQRQQDLYRLAKPEGVEARLASDILVLPDPKILVKKTARLIARHPAQIEVPPAPGLDGVAAQKIENWLYEWDRAQNQRWLAGLHNPYRYDQAFFLLLRGWLVHRTLLNSEYEDDDGEYETDPSALWHHCLVDPANVYPFGGSYEVTRVTHAWTCELGDLRGDPYYDLDDPDDDDLKYLADAPDKTIVNVRATYWKDAGSWWHACVLGAATGSRDASVASSSGWIKQPTEVGYNPWTITVANGASYRQTDWDDIDYLDQIGTGLMDESEDTLRYLSRIATKLNELLSQESNPPVILKSGQGEIKAIDVGPGGRTYLAEKDNLELLRVGPNLGDYQLLWDILEQRLARASLPRQFYAEGPESSGFSTATLMSAGKDVLYPFVECLNQTDALVYKKVLQLYRDYGPSAPLKTRLDPGQLRGAGGAGGGFLPLTGLGQIQSAEITAQEIKAQGTYVEVTRDDMTPQELATRVNLALGLLREKVLSLDTIRKDWLKIKNPRAENLKVLAELVYLNDEVTKALVGPALAQTGEQFLQRIWEMVNNPVPPTLPPEPGNMNMQPALPPGMPPGPQPQPPGLPTQALPPIAGGNLLTNTNVPPELQQINAILGLMNGGAMGGAGSGGLPPVPGSASPVPLFLPPGRPF